MKNIVMLSTLLAFVGTIWIGTASADNGVCVDALDDSALHTTSCTEYGMDQTKQAFCPYTWAGPGAPTYGVFVCGGDPNCEIYYDTFALGLKGCFNGGAYTLVGEELWIVGSTVDALLP